MKQRMGIETEDKDEDHEVRTSLSNVFEMTVGAVRRKIISANLADEQGNVVTPGRFAYRQTIRVEKTRPAAKAAPKQQKPKPKARPVQGEWPTPAEASSSGSHTRARASSSATPKKWVRKTNRDARETIDAARESARGSRDTAQGKGTPVTRGPKPVSVFDRQFPMAREEDEQRCKVCERNSGTFYCRNCGSLLCYTCYAEPNLRCDCSAIYLDPVFNTSAEIPLLTERQLEHLKTVVTEAKPFGWNQETAKKNREQYLELLEASYNLTGNSGYTNLDRLFRSGLHNIDVSENTYPTSGDKVPTIDEHLFQQLDQPLPIQRAEVMVRGWKDDVVVPAHEQEKALDLMGSFLMGHYKINEDHREQNPDTGIETQRDTMTINLALLNLGNLNRAPVFAGKQSFDHFLRDDMNMRPLGNLIFKNPAHIVLLCEAAYVKENFEELCDINQFIGLRATHPLGNVPIACFVRGHSNSGSTVELIRHYSGNGGENYGWTLHTATFRVLFGDKMDWDGSFPTGGERDNPPKSHPAPLCTTRSPTSVIAIHWTTGP